MWPLPQRVVPVGHLMHGSPAWVEDHGALAARTRLGLLHGRDPIADLSGLEFGALLDLARPVIASPARMAEVGLLLAVVALPILIGAGMSYFRRAWWWGAVAAICIFLVAALAPPPEEGESRVALGDLGFLVIVAGIVALLVWIGSWLTGRIRRKSASMN